ncbi:MerR family transcriptional regulator [Nocardia sp. NPDC003482]
MIDGVTIGEAARITGVGIHALRFYEREGLLAGPIGRSRSGQRRYSDRDLEWIVICTKLRATGMPLGRIRRYAELVREGPGNEAERLELLQEHQAAVRRQMGELRENLSLIDYKVQVYRDRLADGQATALWSASG